MHFKAISEKKGSQVESSICLLHASSTEEKLFENLFYGLIYSINNFETHPNWCEEINFRVSIKQQKKNFIRNNIRRSLREFQTTPDNLTNKQKFLFDRSEKLFLCRCCHEENSLCQILPQQPRSRSRTDLPQGDCRDWWSGEKSCQAKVWHNSSHLKQPPPRYCLERWS